MAILGWPYWTPLDKDAVASFYPDTELNRLVQRLDDSAFYAGASAERPRVLAIIDRYINQIEDNAPYKTTCHHLQEIIKQGF